MDATWAALIASGSAVIASAVTGLFTTLAVRNQARANYETQRAQLRHQQAEARHLQRRQAYADFVRAVGIMHTRLADMVAVAGKPAFDSTEQVTRADRVDQMSAAHVAFLEGPAAVGERVRDLHNSVDRLLGAVERLHKATLTDDEEDIRDRREQMLQARTHSRRCRDLFVEAAREAL